MWDDWHAIEAAQAKAAEDDRQRREKGAQLPVVTEEPVARPGPSVAPVDESRPHLRLATPVEPEPERPKRPDLAAGLRLLAKHLRHDYPNEEPPE